MRAEYRTTTASYQPHRLGRPVEAPYSWPLSRRRSAIAPDSSVGSGPSPTRVVYALATPSTPPIARGGTPRPVQTPPADAFDEVTNGYVPWSMSSRVACAPSNSTLFPALIVWCSTSAVSDP